MVGKHIKINEVMEAELKRDDGSLFMIHARQEAEQTVGTTDTTSWVWTIKALEEGDHELFLTHYAVIEEHNKERKS